MTSRDLKRNLLQAGLIILFSFSAVGCQLMHSSVPVAVTIRDAETKAPIPGADVTFLYPNSSDDSLSHLRDSAGKTNASGIVQIRAITGDDVPPPQIKVEVPGYLSQQKIMPGDTLRAVNSSKSFWPFISPRDPIDLGVELYRGPPPVVNLVVPQGFRGIVKVDVRVREDIAYPFGLRTVSADVPPNGSVQVDAPPIFRHENKPEIQARYADESPLPLIPQNARDRDNEVGFRWLRCEGRTEIFVVGTKAELESYRRSGDRGSSSDSGNGKKGGGRRGGGSGGNGS